MGNRDDDKVWVSRAYAGRMLGISGTSFDLMMSRGKAIGTRNLPGLPPRYLRSDVERLARDSVKLANAS